MMAQKILLIEDDQFIQDLYKEELKAQGFEVEAYLSGKEGLEAALHNSYDLILLDIMLPDTNGLEILKKIKQEPNGQNIKVVLLTNLGSDKVIKEGFQLGAEGYLIKASYNPDQIIEEVKKFLTGKSRVDIPKPVTN